MPFERNSLSTSSNHSGTSSGLNGGIRTGLLFIDLAILLGIADLSLLHHDRTFIKF